MHDSTDAAVPCSGSPGATRTVTEATTGALTGAMTGAESEAVTACHNNHHNL